MSLAPSTPVRVIERDGYALTNYRALCRRGVLWIGQTCNLRCHFCYFLDKIMDRNHPEHDFFELDKLKAMCKTLVDVYGNNSVDIQGGEPTIYRHITDLIRYCNEIGLKPTLITNGQVLANPEKCRQLKEAGVYDLLISVHGLGQRYDKIVVVNGAAAKLQKAIDNVAAAGIPFRFNCVLCTDALPDLMGVAKLAVAKGARAVNYIAFNPFIDQACGGKRSAENVPRYSDVVDYLLPVLDYLDAHGVEVNVRYLPSACSREVPKFVQNFQQIVYDLHEWESAGEAWSGAEPQRQTLAPLSEPDRLLPSHRGAAAELLQEGAASAAGRQRWGASVAATLDALEARVRRSGPLSVSLYGSAAVGNAIREARGVAAGAAAGGHVQGVHLLGAVPHRRNAGRPAVADAGHALGEPVDVVLNTSESSRGAITEVLKGHGPRGVHDRSVRPARQGADRRRWRRESDSPIPGRAGYEYLPYLPELGPMPDASVLEQAYKEFRVIMPKTMHPYAKGEECAKCSLRGICDGFHRDYAEIFGFAEAVSQQGAAVTHPCHYAQDQLKVVEEQEYDWALPEGHPLQLRLPVAGGG